jgi:hypothetical protein
VQAVRAAQRWREAHGLRGPLTVIGMAGLAVTRRGIALTTIVYGSRERDSFVADEYLEVPREPGPPSRDAAAPPGATAAHEGAGAPSASPARC